MKKITYTTLKAQPAKKIRHKKTICDFCDKESRYECSLCGRDICYTISDSHTKFDPREWGDYPGKYCPDCYEIRYEGAFNEAYNQMQQRHENEEIGLDHQIKIAAMEKRKEAGK